MVYYPMSLGSLLFGVFVLWLIVKFADAEEKKEAKRKKLNEEKQRLEKEKEILEAQKKELMEQLKALEGSLPEKIEIKLM